MRRGFPDLGAEYCPERTSLPGIPRFWHEVQVRNFGLRELLATELVEEWRRVIADQEELCWREIRPEGNIRHCLVHAPQQCEEIAGGLV